MPDMPEWVQVWSWLRFLRQPQVKTPLPQQEPDPDTMSEERYQEFRSEWAIAGTPSLSTKEVVAAMSGQIVNADDDFPDSEQEPNVA